MSAEDIMTVATKALQFYDIETREHARRVAEYVKEYESQLGNDYIVAIAAAYMHDLLEDTDYDPEKDENNSFWFPYVIDIVQILTKPKNMSYDDYCRAIHDKRDTWEGRIAWFVKLADMKDHLNQVETLTPRLKEKYLSGLRYLL